MNLKPILQQEDKSSKRYSSINCQQLLTMYENFYNENDFIMPWVGYFIIKQETVVGSCGFVGQPKDGKIEIAYWTFREYEGQGIASFACKELISIAYQTDSTLLIIAKTAPEENASTKILKNNNFEFTRIFQDEEIGTAWLWTHKK